MKYSIILSLFTLLGCSQSIENTVEKENVNSTKEDTTNIIQQENVASHDTIPNWMIDIYEKNDHLPEHIQRQKVKISKQLNDSIFYGIVDQYTGICSSKFLVTLLNQKEKSREVLENFCDHDSSYGVYKWREFDFVSSDKIIVREFEEKVDDSFMDENGWIKDGHDFGELETSVDSIQMNLKIKQDGVISKEK